MADRCLRRMAEEGDRQAFAKLLVDEKAHDLALAQRADHAERGLASLAENVAAVIRLPPFQQP